MLTRAAVICLLSITALPAVAQKVMITDPSSNCATSNPFPKGNERITWTGGCRNGLLDGQGVLTWYRDERMTERNEGSFRNGEMHGESTTTFPDGSSVVGTYSEGRRNGEFVVIRGDGTYIRAVYQNDKLVSERELSRRQVRAMIDERRSQPAQRVREAPEPAAAAAPVYQPQPAYQAQPAYAAPAPVPVAPVATAAAVPTIALPVAAAAVPAPRAAGASNYVPPWSPTANAAAVSGRGGYAAAATPQPVYQQPAYQQPAYQQPAYQQPVYAAPAATAVAPQPTYAAAPPPPMVAAPPTVAQPTAVAAPSGMVARRVCTAPGLYPNNAGWCGIVRAEQPGEIQVEITDVRVNSIFAIGISPGECTGAEFIGSGSKGSKVWVPSRCMR